MAVVYNLHTAEGIIAAQEALKAELVAKTEAFISQMPAEQQALFRAINDDGVVMAMVSQTVFPQN